MCFLSQDGFFVVCGFLVFLVHFTQNASFLEKKKKD